MNWLVDMGNTTMKWCEEGNTAAYRTAVFPDRANPDFFQTHWSGLADVDAIWVGAVGSAAWLEQLQVFVRAKKIPLHVVQTAPNYGPMRNAYNPPESLGIDRWLAAMGAWYRLRQAVVVVDAGTAVTVDAVTGAGVFLGGAILPGWRLCAQALEQGTAALAVTADATHDKWPDTTAAAFQCGVRLAVVGGITAAITMAEEALGEPCRHMICGGDGAALSQYLGINVEQVPDLVLQGLQRVADR